MYIHHVSCDSSHGSSFSHKQEDGVANYLFVHFKSPTLLIVNQKTYSIAPPSIILFSPYTPFQYRALCDGYCDDYLHFAPDDEEEFASKLHFPMNIPITILNDLLISDLFQAVSREYYMPSACHLAVQYHHLMLLSLRIGDEWSRQQPDCNIPYFEPLSALRKKIRENPSHPWRISDMADEVMLSPAYFQVLYKRAFGVTCIADVIQAKTDLAKELLLSSNLSIAAIAEELGYSQVYHFIRQFKKSTGITPGAFRKMLS